MKIQNRTTTADVLEALHHATGMPIVADFYTRLYKPEAVSVQDRPLFDALNHLADTMRLRWHKEGSWLQFRSTSFYDDRLKEVPNRLLPLQRHAVLRPLLQVQSLEDQRGQAHLRPDRAEHQARHAETEQPHERRHFDQQQRADQQQRQHTAQVEERCHRRRGQRQQRQRRSAERLLGPPRG